MTHSPEVLSGMELVGRASIDPIDILVMAKMAYTLLELDADEDGYPNVESLFGLTTQELDDLHHRLAYIATEAAESLGISVDDKEQFLKVWHTGLLSGLRGD